MLVAAKMEPTTGRRVGLLSLTVRTYGFRDRPPKRLSASRLLRHLPPDGQERLPERLAEIEDALEIFGLV